MQSCNDSSPIFEGCNVPYTYLEFPEKCEKSKSFQFPKDNARSSA